METQNPIPVGVFLARTNDSTGMQCWVCLATGEEDPADWIDPCNCIGTTKWVHLPCLMRWVDEKQRGNLDQPVSCPHCNAPYRIKVPRRSLLVVFLDKLDRQTHVLSHLMAGCIIIGSVYWLALSYGAISIMQVLGQDEGMAAFQRAEPMVLFFGLPAVPLALICSRFITWDDTVMHFFRYCAKRFRFVGRLFPLFAVEKPTSHLPFPDWEKSNQGDTQTRLVCGGLLMPSIATFVGNLLYNSFSAIQRAVFGGLTYIFVKGLINIYHKQDIYFRMCKRTVLRSSGGDPISFNQAVEAANRLTPPEDALTPEAAATSPGQ